ncbi:MAG: galactokinase [Planctomycetota bacterium]|nr:galactokinase [Planctomycetota bacterium]
MDQDAELKERFVQIFGPGGRIHVIRAPGRVNLIGEHTDYNDGFVFPMAIEPEVKIVCRTRKDDIVKVSSTVFTNEFVEFSLGKKIERGKPTWGNYVRGVAAELIGAGIPLAGMDALISNTLPVGGGLSSSAAIEVSTARALLLLCDLTMDVDRLALICQKAEHEYALVPCGIMDQMIVAGGKIGHAMLLDCRSLSKKYVPLDPKELRVLIANSMVKHELSGGEYAMRRRECEEGVAILQRTHPGIKALRDVTMQQVNTARSQMSDVVYRRCRHVVGENLRTVEMARQLAEQHYEAAGELMVQSHNSLRDDYEVSCIELDFLVESAMRAKGVYGARMTGGGFGGSIVALVVPRAVEQVSAEVHKAYTERFGRQPNIFVTNATAGATVLE